MSNNTDIRKISDEITKEYREFVGEEKWNNQLMWNSFVQQKLAQFELRLRHLEKSAGRANDFLNMHTPIGI